MSALDVNTASNTEIIQYVTQIYKRFLDENRPSDANQPIVDFLQQLVEARPGRIDEQLQQYIKFVGVSLKIPQQTINALIRASNGQESLAGRRLLYENAYRLPDNMAAEAAGGGRRRRRTTKRRKNSRKSRKSRRHQRRRV